MLSATFLATNDYQHKKKHDYSQQVPLFLRKVLEPVRPNDESVQQVDDIATATNQARNN